MKKQDDKRYYLAYGSNLNVPQMRRRCPGATILGTAKLRGWELLFRGSKTGSYLTIEEREGCEVPVAVWVVTPEDEAALDRYEGFPGFYYKKEFRVQYKGILTGRRRKITAFAYIMHEDRKVGIPSKYYMDVCREGYADFGFDAKKLSEAFKASLEGCRYEGK